MATVYVNDRAVDIGDERLNCVQAAQRAGVTIPHYCWHAALSVVASCRMCLVEVGERKVDEKGEVSTVMQPKVVPGCQTPVKDGTVIRTSDAKSKDAQQRTLESLLLNHPLDCPVCDKAGECLLQDYSFQFGKAESRMVDEKRTPPNKPDIGPHVNLFTDRCIMCSRCVRFTREVSGTAELHIVNRGTHAEIDVFEGHPLDNKLSLNVVDLCPVGALASKDFLYTQRVWNLKSANAVCGGCSTGCSVHVDSNKDIVYRLRPRFNPRAQGHFMCDAGRLGYHHVNDPARLRQYLVRGENGTRAVDWAEAAGICREKLGAAASRDPGRVWFVFSPSMTVEEAWLLANYARQLSPFVKLAMGAIVVEGADDTFPKDRKGRPAPQVKFTIRAEKAANVRGVRGVLAHFQKERLDYQQFLQAARGGQVDACLISQGQSPAIYKPGVEEGDALAGVAFVAVQELFASPLTDRAHVVVPASAFSEVDGTWVNHAGLAQAKRASCAPWRGTRTDGQFYLELLGRKGLVHAGNLRREVAKAIPGFKPLEAADLGEYGVFCEKLKDLA